MKFLIISHFSCLFAGMYCFFTDRDHLLIASFGLGVFIYGAAAVVLYEIQQRLDSGFEITMNEEEEQ